ncbi:uncharacterized protein I303_103174 [Kwoniella dejecticola CBS 10117]|uniref:Uncharacterized protein n=1 Tax=Kwoniella dejecticola CBS 10117 TaxID=1296121 RepID=A0A1A6AAS8_9TREE|nr:uncharacterized protein I303_03195 [Kwoniella dejecticola CBS 10117]OBR87171.1 hypothetical protein I303_03195 [Kwoniella dejecticola CBS 10117]
MSLIPSKYLNSNETFSLFLQVGHRELPVIDSEEDRRHTRAVMRLLRSVIDEGRAPKATITEFQLQQDWCRVLSGTFEWQLKVLYLQAGVEFGIPLGHLVGIPLDKRLSLNNNVSALSIYSGSSIFRETRMTCLLSMVTRVESVFNPFRRQHRSLSTSSSDKQQCLQHHWLSGFGVTTQLPIP